MAERKEYFVEGVEKYLHFSTGLMFAVAAAAIQSAKLESAGILQIWLELSGWVFLLAAAIFGIFTALKHSSELETLDRYKISEEILQDEGRPTMADSKAEASQVDPLSETESSLGAISQKIRWSVMEELSTAYESYSESKRVITKRNRKQAWIFVIGLSLLAGARAIPAFTHRSNQSIVVSVTK